MTNNKILSPMIAKFAGAWCSSNWPGISDPATSPRSPLDFNSQSDIPTPSPRGLKNYHLGGVGLGIVVEMEKSGDVISANKEAFSQSLIQPNPYPVLEVQEDGLEEYTLVTYHGPSKSYARVYCDESGRFNGRNYDRIAIFYIDSPISEDTQHPPPNFLKSCHLCQKPLHGLDIYMYRGEKGFCSNECRYQQITMAERNEK